MNYASLIDVHDKNELNELENIMKNFKYVFHQDIAEKQDIVNIQAIMEEGRIDDLMKCIQNILNYSFNTYAKNNVTIIDPSFIKFFHVAQLIIRFLLYWKSELRKDNIKLKIKCQEIEKLRKECFTKKLEIKDMKNLLFKRQKLDNCEFRDSNISECPQCRKVFVNATFLRAHYKRRHADQLFPNTGGLNEFQLIQDEISSLKYQMKKLSAKENQFVHSSDIINKHNEDSAVSLKMKIIPEQSCLEAQEKYWRGKVKELKSLSEELILENSNLKKEIADIKNISQKCTAAVQTEISLITQDISETYNAVILNQNDAVNTNIKNEFKLQRITSIPDISNKKIENPTQDLCETSTFTKKEFSSSNAISLADEKLVKMKLYNFDDPFSVINKKVDILNRDLFANSFSSRVFDYSNEIPQCFLPAHSSKSSSISCLNDRNEIEICSPRRSLQHEKSDIVEEVESFLENYDRSKVQIGRNNELFDSNSAALNGLNCNTQHKDVKNVITKLFTEDTDSAELAEKLIKIYEKRRSLVSEDEGVTGVVNENDLFNNERADIAGIHDENVDELIDKDSSASNEKTTQQDGKPGTIEDRIRSIDEDHTTIEEIKSSTLSSSDEADKIITNESLQSTNINLIAYPKEKSKILPFFRNIPSRIIKNCSISRKTCINMIESKLIRKLPPLSSQNATVAGETFGPAEQESLENTNVLSKNSTPSIHYKQQHDFRYNLKNNVKCLPEISAANKSEDRSLVSALKKSKSTGNITKKVAFMENLPTFKTVSETDLTKIPGLKPKQILSVPNTEANILEHVYPNKFIYPVPAPRNKKNVILSKSEDRDIEENVN